MMGRTGIRSLRVLRDRPRFGSGEHAGVAFPRQRDPGWFSIKAVAQTSSQGSEIEIPLCWARELPE